MTVLEEFLNGTCSLTVYVNQTDYDRDMQSNEMINFIQV